MIAALRRLLAPALPPVSLDAARTRAAAGAAYLDGADPGWALRLDARSLALGDGQACVLGQLHGEYRMGLGRARIFDLSSAPGSLFAAVSPVDLGFQAIGTRGSADEALDYAHLTRAWREEVARRGPVAAPASRPLPRAAGVSAP